MDERVHIQIKYWTSLATTARQDQDIHEIECARLDWQETHSQVFCGILLNE